MTSLRIVRNVTDADPAMQTVWEGTLDLAPDAGAVVNNTMNADLGVRRLLREAAPKYDGDDRSLLDLDVFGLSSRPSGSGG